MSGRPKPAFLPLARGRQLELGGRRHVMGILNATPDSFYGASRASDPGLAASRAVAMVRSGATLVDVGGESTRPGSAYVEADEEIRRVAPVIAAVRRALELEGLDAALSVDTRKAAVAAAALDAGADLVNDVAALLEDPDLATLCAERGVPVILMHKKGLPSSMQEAPRYDDVVAEVCAFLLDAARRAEDAGIDPGSIVLDPGIGFGKRLEDNLALLARLDELAACGYPLLVGLSRKSFIGLLTGRPAEERLPGSLGAACAAWLGGADIFRVHDVQETADALRVLAACRAGRPTEGYGAER
ncbi:MAG TPA: dihydropteroate synthase [Spirochaetales bacterium]|nr:dihydropteroate synthase [Spirochaetales bacterium]